MSAKKKCIATSNCDSRLTGRLRIGVIGAGIGGLTAALCFERFGHKVNLFEQSTTFGEVGAGLQLSPNALDVLDALGLQDTLEAHADRLFAVELADFRHGAIVARLNLAKFAQDQMFLALHRADLHAILVRAAHDRGICITLGTAVADTDPKGVITFADGERQTFDLIVAADGVHSRHRRLVDASISPQFTNQVAWRALVPNDQSGLPRGDAVARVVMGPGKHIVSYPLRGGSMINVVAVEETPDWTAEGWSLPGEPGQLHARFSEFGGEMTDLLSKVQSAHRWGLFSHRVPKSWHRERLVLMGDAAHPMLPFLAQGAAMAIEDAYVLASLVSAQHDLSQALYQYAQMRGPRVTRVMREAQQNARRYHVRNPVFRTIAHRGLRSLGRFAPKQLVSRFDWLYRYDPTSPSAHVKGKSK